MERPSVPWFICCGVYVLHWSSRKDQGTLKRSPLKRKTPLFRKKKLNKVSTKQTQRNIKYYRIRDQYMKEHPVCEVCGLEPSRDLHHKKGRSGDLLFDTQFFMAVSRKCHDRIHQNPEWAKESGFLIPWWKVNEPDGKVSDHP